jgi:hypothetical protein
VHFQRQGLCDARQAILQQIVVMLGGHRAHEVPVFIRLVVTRFEQAVDLEEEAFAVIACGEAGRIEPVLKLGQRFLEVFEGDVDVGQGLDLFEDGGQVGGEQAVIVDVPDEAATDVGDGVVDFRKGPMVHELLGEALAAGGDAGHGVHLAVALTVGAADRTGRVFVFEGIAVGGFEGAQSFPVVLGRWVRSRRRRAPSARRVRCAHHRQNRRRWRRHRRWVRPVRARCWIRVPARCVLEGQHGQLQDLHGLDHPRRQFHLLAELHVL